MSWGWIVLAVVVALNLASVTNSLRRIANAAEEVARDVSLLHQRR